MRENDPRDATIAQLTARVSGLERLLERRSADLQILLSQLCPVDAVKASQLLGGPVPSLVQTANYYQLDWWTKTTKNTLRDVAPVLGRLWETAPARHPAEEA